MGGGNYAKELSRKSDRGFGKGDTTDNEETQSHMQNFVDCVRSRKQPNCPFEIGFRSAIACQMAVASYRAGRTVNWDQGREEIV